MSENEYEPFEITDYDLDNEFNPNRTRRRQTKHEQIYGIWADDSENESTGSRHYCNGKPSTSGKNKDYSAPVSFVAGGIQQAGKNNINEALTDDDISDADVANTRLTFGRKQPQLKELCTEIYEASDWAEESAKSKTSSIHNSHIPKYKNVGAWEQHTRGIGAKLLLQMGYKPGKGLGKDLQGISQPVEAHVRKGRGAIGAYGSEIAASTSVKVKLKHKVSKDENETPEFKGKFYKWKRGDQEQQKIRRYYYTTVEEVIENGKKSNYLLGENISKKLDNVPVIDMTGPEKRVLSGYHALASSKVIDEDLYDLDILRATTVKQTSLVTKPAFALPELVHNLNLIVKMCEQNIIVIDKTERETNEKKSALEYEQSNLHDIVKLEKAHISTLEHALDLVAKLTENNDELTLERAEQIFIRLQKNYAAEYKAFGLGDLAAGVIAPLVKIKLEKWQPLTEPKRHLELIKTWRNILESNDDRHTEQRNVFDPYSSLIWAGVIPSFRACVSNWNPKKHQCMAALLDCWAPLFPTWILDSVMEQIVLPQLTQGVRNWDPLTDTVPIHIWILPWHGILGEKLNEFVYPTIREKLGAALQAWIPQDRSARAILLPWKMAFSEGDMHAFLLQHIIPKLQLTLNEFIINPMQQDLELWNQVSEWQELIPPILMAQLLDKYFFPKWMQVLVLWLNQSPDYAEISRWYTGWKSMLSDEILREPNVKEHLRRALEMMHRATDNIANITLPLSQASSGIKMSNINEATPLQPPSLLDLQIPIPAQLEFKELILLKCSERGILFAPIPGRREMGKQIYRVGKLYCYIDRNVCMVSDSTFNKWLPTSVVSLLERAS